MKLKLIDKNNGTWCIHIEPSGSHLAAMTYAGSGSWKLEIVQGNSSIIEEVKASTVDEAFRLSCGLIEKNPACIEFYTAEAGSTSHYSEKAIIFNEILALYFRAFSTSGAEGQNEYLNIMSNALGNTIAMSGADAEMVIAGTCEIMRETVTARQEMMSASVEHNPH